MARDILDDRLLGALHLRSMTRAGLAHDRSVEHTAFQAGTLDALMGGRYEGELTIGELLAHGDLGIGTVQHLDGELVIVDGTPFVVRGDGTVSVVSHSTRTPFAVVARFEPTASAYLDGPLSLPELHASIDALVPGPSDVVSVRIDGTFSRLRLRSVAAQRPPYPPLSEVTRHQCEWRTGTAEGTIVGFRFPDLAAGVEVPGYHLHLVSTDRRIGGHVIDLALVDGVVQVDGGNDLHVALPEGVGLGIPGAADRAAIVAVEGG